MKTFAIASLLVLGMLCFFGCTVDDAVDCQGICNRYQECFDEDYDVSDCTARCVDDSADEGFDTRADACDACIDDESCLAGAFKCASQCSGIVP